MTTDRLKLLKERAGGDPARWGDFKPERRCSIGKA
jgi:hypothetical protein